MVISTIINTIASTHLELTPYIFFRALEIYLYFQHSLIRLHQYAIYYYQFQSTFLAKQRSSYLLIIAIIRFLRNCQLVLYAKYVWLIFMLFVSNLALHHLDNAVIALVLTCVLLWQSIIIVTLNFAILMHHSRFIGQNFNPSIINCASATILLKWQVHNFSANCRDS